MVGVVRRIFDGSAAVGCVALITCFLCHPAVQVDIDEWKGMLYSFGIFQEYYSIHEPFASESGIALIGTCGTGLAYIGGLAVFPVYQRWPATRMYSFYLGLPLLPLSLLAASFATCTAHLILTQGIFYGVAGTLMYNPVLLLLQEWFVARKGLAFGVMWAGTGVAGVTVPFVLAALLRRFGWRATLRVWALVLAVLSLPLEFSIRPRIPASAAAHGQRFDLGFLTCRTFWILLLTNAVQGLGNFMPTIYIPSYAHALGLDPMTGTLVLALINGASFIACPIVGKLVDHLHIATVISAISLVAAGSVFFLWGLGVSKTVLAIFGILYGLSAGSYATTYAGVVREVQAREPGADSGLVFGFLSASRGVGSVVSGPMSESLLALGAWKGTAALGYGTEYGSLIILTGLTAAVGALTWCVRWAGWM